MNNLTIEYRRDDDEMNWYVCDPTLRNEFDESYGILKFHEKQDAELAKDGIEGYLHQLLVIPERVDN